MKAEEPQKQGENNPKLNVGAVEPCYGYWACVTASRVDGERKRPQQQMLSIPSLSSLGEKLLYMQSGAIPTKSWRDQASLAHGGAYRPISLCCLSLPFSF